MGAPEKRCRATPLPRQRGIGIAEQAGAPLTPAADRRMPLPFPAVGDLSRPARSEATIPSVATRKLVVTSRATCEVAVTETCYWRPFDRLLASRILPPRSGLERSDFVLWHTAVDGTRPGLSAAGESRSPGLRRSRSSKEARWHVLAVCHRAQDGVDEGLQLGRPGPLSLQ